MTLHSKFVIAVALGMSATGGYFFAGLPQAVLATVSPSHESAHGAPAERTILYYRDPSGAPYWSATPKKDAQGRDYRPVYDNEEVSFDPALAKPRAEKGERRILYYRNPMGLPDTSPVPKKDSMGMDYIPVYEGEEAEAEGGSTIRVSPGKLQRTGVRSEPVGRHVVSRSVRAPGAVQLDERRVAVVSLRAEGFLEKVENVTTGDRVHGGQPLLRVYSPEVSTAAAQYLSVVAGPNGASPLLLDGARRRLENLNVPPELVAEIERTRKVPRTVTWPAPREGVVLERTAVDGMRAAPGDVLFRIADLSMVWVLVDVAEHDLGAIRPGQPVSLRVHALPGQNFVGRVGLIYPQVNKETRTTRVRIEIPNPDGVLLPDMYAEVDIMTGSASPVIAVPEHAVIDTGRRRIVILDKGEGRFEPREVTIGARGQGLVEIRDGVAEGDQVVVAANFLIDAESNLKAALRSMTAGEKER